MMPLKIEPLCVGMNAGSIGAGGDRQSRLHQDGPSEGSYVGAMLMFLITGGSRVVLVDTGPRHEAWTREHHGMLVERPPELRPEKVLGRHGMEPADIDTVINTHLHWDHCSNNALFSRATFYAQRDELLYACDPLPIHRRAYEKAPGLTPGWLDVWGRLELVDGDAEVAPGISVVKLPGHSPGSQGVLVEVEGMSYLLAGDTVNTYADWEGNETLRHIPPAVHTSLVDCFDSFDRIDRLGCEVVPSHDISLVSHGSFVGVGHPHSHPCN
jgi:N-acyl homoserine lactone hydrolase